jgi:pimeloyl-ACP methyl ester carboxylesterase
MRVVLVHGSVGNGPATFASVEPLREHLEVVIPNRGGYPPNPPLERIDFEEQVEELAPLLEDGSHLVGHSYGGVISLLIAAKYAERVRSLTVSEPPAFGVGRGRPEVERLLAELTMFFAAGPYEPAAYLHGFLALVGSGRGAAPAEPHRIDRSVQTGARAKLERPEIGIASDALDLPEPLPPDLEQGARAAMAERSPAEAVIPLDGLAATEFPKLVISGAHHPAFDAVCDVLEERLGAERAVLPGAGHSIPRAPGYLEQLTEFLERA